MIEKSLKSSLNVMFIEQTIKINEYNHYLFSNYIPNDFSNNIIIENTYKLESVMGNVT